MPGAPLAVFICHASADRELGSELASLLARSLRIPAGAIRYTSDASHGLSAGEDHVALLASECTAAPVFIALVSRRFLASSYAMMELGARWGAGKDVKPMLLHGLRAAALPAPISPITAVDATDFESIRRMLQDLHQALHQSPLVEPPADDQLARFVRVNRWRRWLPRSSHVLRGASVAIVALATTVAFRAWNEREAFREPARACRDGIDKLVTGRIRTATTSAELSQAIVTDTNGCIEHLSVVAGDR